MAVAAFSLVATMTGGGVALDRLTTAVTSGACPQLYVSPSGNDQAKGTADDPWKSVAKARDHIREMGLNSESVIQRLGSAHDCVTP
ncbi:hypothetical protein [Promicromonospora aerolata]|uniref:Uncharacterized protein n=1 Tax=Promicromonospora aerolata TaxID=195749 RepID=A0ABW4VGI4_9MICO